MKTLFFSLIFAQFLSAPASAQPLEEQARKPVPTGVARPKAQPPTVRTTQDPRAGDPYRALVENASRSADQFRSDNTSRNQDRDHIEGADNSQPAAVSDNMTPQRKPKKPSL